MKRWLPLTCSFLLLPKANMLYKMLGGPLWPGTSLILIISKLRTWFRFSATLISTNPPWRWRCLLKKLLLETPQELHWGVVLPGVTLGGMTPGGALPCMPLSMTATAILQHKGAELKKEAPYTGARSPGTFDKLKSSSLHLLERFLAKMQHYASWGRKGRLGAAKSLSQTLYTYNQSWWCYTTHPATRDISLTLWSRPQKKEPGDTWY